jgi:hypothetical protein
MALLSKEEIEEIEKIEGKIIGNASKNKFNFVLEKVGKEGIRKIEEEMRKIGHPIKYEEMKNFNWYPAKEDLYLTVIIKRLFNFSDDEIREMGRFNARISLIAKTMMRYFISIEKVAKEVGNYWRKYRTIGKLEAEKIDIENKEIVLVLKDFTGHPIFCRFLEGYFWQISSYVISEKENLKVEEIECVFKGGKVHRFKITW